MKNTLLILLTIILTGCDLYHGKMYSKKELISLKVGDSVYVRDSVVYYYGDTMKLQKMSHYFSVVYLDIIYGSDTIKLISHEEDN